MRPSYNLIYKVRIMMNAIQATLHRNHFEHSHRLFVYAIHYFIFYSHLIYAEMMTQCNISMLWSSQSINLCLHSSPFAIVVIVLKVAGEVMLSPAFNCPGKLLVVASLTHAFFHRHSLRNLRHQYVFLPP